MKKKIVAVLLSAAMVMAMAVGCSSGKPAEKAEGGKAGKAEDMTFVVVPKCVHAWFDEVNKGAQKEADLLSEQLGVEVKIDYRAPESAEVSEQNSTLEQAAATNPTAILLDPVDYDGSADIIKEIQDRDIPVILFDAPSPEGSGLTSVGNDFSEQATIAVEMLVEEMGTSGKVAVMQGAPTAPNHAERYQAHLDALAKYPDIEVIDGGIDNDNVETAQSQAAAVLAANPDLTGYLNCDACGSGVAAAIEEKGMQDKVTFVAMDNLIEILDYVKSGTITATSSTLPQEQGMYAVLPGHDKPHVSAAIPVLMKKKQVGQRVVVIGGGDVGCELACELKLQGKEVTIIEMLDDILMAGESFVANHQNIRYLVERSGVALLCGAKVSEILDDGVLVSKNGEIQKVNCDSVVFATGYRANSDLYMDILKAGFEGVQIGDNVKPGKIINAIHQGYHCIRVLEED